MAAGAERHRNWRFMLAAAVVATSIGAPFGMGLAAVGLAAGATLGAVILLVRRMRAQRAAAAVREARFRKRVLDELRVDWGPYRR